jgi:hypothetical protein
MWPWTKTSQLPGRFENASRQPTSSTPSTSGKEESEANRGSVRTRGLAARAARWARDDVVPSMDRAARPGWSAHR